MPLFRPFFRSASPHARIKRFLMLPLVTMAAFPLSGARAQDSKNSQDGVPVSIAVATTQNLPIELRNIGSVQANQSVLIKTRVDGTIDKILFTEGQEVKAGQPIVQIDPRPYQAVLEQALAKQAADQAQLANAKLDLARYAQLAHSQFASRQSVDTQTATVAQLQAQLKSDAAAIDAAQLNLTYTTITAPFDGRMGLRQMDVGAIVRFADTSSVGIVTISQIHPIAVLFSLPQQQLPAVQAAMAKSQATGGSLQVTAFASDNTTRLGVGKLLTVDNAINAASGTIQLKAIFPNTDNRLWPGQFVNAEVLVGTREHVLTVPSIGVQHAQGRRFVYMVQPDSTVVAQTVEVGEDNGHVAVITKGLEAGAKVVVNGQSRLRQGTRVSVVAGKNNS